LDSGRRTGAWQCCARILAAESNTATAEPDRQIKLKLKQFQIIPFVRARALAYDGRMGRRPVESEFKIEIFKDRVTAHFRPTRSLYTFARFTTERDIADFGPVSPDPVIQHGSRSSGTGVYDSAEVLAMAFRLAVETAGRAGT
jgi:hypothetical protein